MTEQVFNFWQDHSLSYLEMAFKNDRQGRFDKPDGLGKRTGDCGDTVEISLRIEKDIIKSVLYKVEGCLNTNACANAVVRLAKGKQAEEAWSITPEEVAAYLETLPESHMHCAELAAGALYQALADYQRNK